MSCHPRVFPGACCGEVHGNRTHRIEVMPDTISYATVLHSYANVGNAREAERMLDHMEKSEAIHSGPIGSRPTLFVLIRPCMVGPNRWRMMPHIVRKICFGGWKCWPGMLPRGAFGQISSRTVPSLGRGRDRMHLTALSGPRSCWSSASSCMRRKG